MLYPSVLLANALAAFALNLVRVLLGRREACLFVERRGCHRVLLA